MVESRVESLACLQLVCGLWGFALKYVIASCLAMAACLVVGAIATHLAKRWLHARWPRWLQAVLSVMCSMVIVAVVCVVYVEQYYHATLEAQAALAGVEGVQVSEASNGWLFDGPGEDTILVFYPGAKVEASAYAPLMSRVASSGVDCYLARMPMRLAVLNVDAADPLMEAYDYDHWMVGGHSMGGVSAALYAAESADCVEGLILLAAYPAKPIDDDMVVVSVYGDHDEVLDLEAYEEARGLLPSDMDELVIEGGNHAGFGNYGEQRGDGQASISADVQQDETATAIAQAANKIQGF